MDKKIPVLETKRLILRPFSLQDAAEVQRLAGDYDIASTTLSIQHPYEDGGAELWISTHQTEYDRGSSATFAITLRGSGILVGAIALSGIHSTDENGELGYWIGKPYWNQGYCTEAARCVVAFGFDHFALNRIYARHFRRNPASGNIMQKIGMIHEGCLRQHHKKWDHFEDIECYGILKSEFKK